MRKTECAALADQIPSNPNTDIFDFTDFNEILFLCD